MAVEKTATVFKQAVRGQVVRFTFSSINSKVIMFDDWILEGVIFGKQYFIVENLT